MKTDSHPSAYACYLISAQILRSIVIDHCVSADSWVEQALSGDLAKRFFGVPLYEIASIPHSGKIFQAGERLERTRYFRPSEAGNTGTNVSWQCASAPVKMKVIAFANSVFGVGQTPLTVSWWLSRIFSEFHFIWGSELKADYIDKIEPELVICQTVERFLFNRLPES